MIQRATAPLFTRPALAGLFALAALLGIAALLASSGPAQADSASISVTNTAGQSDPAAGVPRIFTVSGIAAVPEEVFVSI